MNLQELKLQAGIQDNPDQEGLDLFAQLVVEECCNIAEANEDKSAGCGYITKTVRERIKEHFGLK